MRVECLGRGWITIEVVSGPSGGPDDRQGRAPLRPTLPIYIAAVVTISITIAAFEAISATLPDDADAFPPQVDERAGVRFVIDHKTLDRLRALRARASAT